MNQVDLDAHVACSLCWHDKEMNACGVKAGAAAECHAIERLALTAQKQQHEIATLEAELELLKTKCEVFKETVRAREETIAERNRSNERLRGLLNDPVRLRKFIEKKMDEEALQEVFK